MRRFLKKIKTNPYSFFGVGEKGKRGGRVNTTYFENNWFTFLVLNYFLFGKESRGSPPPTCFYFGN